MRRALSAVALLAAFTAGCTGPTPAGSTGGTGRTTAVRVAGERIESPIIVPFYDGFVPGPMFAEFPLVSREVLAEPGAGTVYRYGEDPVYIDVFVYPRIPGVGADETVEQTLEALQELGRRGTVGEVTVVEDTTVIVAVQYEGPDVPVRHVFMRYRMHGEIHHSHLFLMESGTDWVKVRASYVNGTLSDTALHYAALDYLAGG